MWINAQIDLPNKDIFIDWHLGNIVIKAYQLDPIEKKVTSPIERIKKVGQGQEVRNNSIIIKRNSMRNN